jgi:hypothetical protein
MKVWNKFTDWFYSSPSHVGPDDVKPAEVLDKTPNPAPIELYDPVYEERKYYTSKLYSMACSESLRNGGKITICSGDYTYSAIFNYFNRGSVCLLAESSEKEIVVLARIYDQNEVIIYYQPECVQATYDIIEEIVERQQMLLKKQQEDKINFILNAAKEIKNAT